MHLSCCDLTIFRQFHLTGELKNLRNVVAEAKAKDVKVVPAVVKRMLDRNMFLFGFVDVNESSAAERLDELSEVQNASIQIACKKLFANSRIEHFTHMDMVCLISRIYFQLCTFAYSVHMD
uniref:Uncharacterized protein n=1 Tax=Solanum tuberosum TaxID=4113 RepID=M1D1S8_SOLTU